MANDQLWDLLGDCGEYTKEVWKSRCNVLAVWALICIELELPSDQDLDLRLEVFGLAIEDFPGGHHPNWFGQLAFDLVQISGRSEIYSVIISDALWRTIQQAARSFRNENRDFFQDGLDGLNALDWILGTKNNQKLGSLSNTTKLLRTLGDKSINEADYLLAMVWGDLRGRECWLRKAGAGAWPTSQVAALSLGNLLKSQGKYGWRDQLSSVKFPSEEDVDFNFLSAVALKAKSQLSGVDFSLNLPVNYSERFYDWSVKAEDVAKQWETVERCTVRLQDLVSAAECVAERDGSAYVHPIDLPEHVRSVTLETGRLVEAFLKWCLNTWFPNERNLDLTTDLAHQTDYHFVSFVGSILGKAEGVGSIDLAQLLSETGLNITKHQVHELIGPNKKAKCVWTCTKANIASLVVANAMAAKCYKNHPFRHVERTMLVAALDAFHSAYIVRNSIAHFGREVDGWISDEEAIFWATVTRERVDQLMSESVLLM